VDEVLDFLFFFHYSFFFDGITLSTTAKKIRSIMTSLDAISCNTSLRSTTSRSWHSSFERRRNFSLSELGFRSWTCGQLSLSFSHFPARHHRPLEWSCANKVSPALLFERAYNMAVNRLKSQQGYSCRPCKLTSSPRSVVDLLTTDFRSVRLILPVNNSRWRARLSACHFSDVI
jgi:hypothetical protein